MLVRPARKPLWAGCFEVINAQRDISITLLNEALAYVIAQAVRLRFAFIRSSSDK